MKKLLQAIKNHLRNMYISTLVIIYDAIYYPTDEINNNKANDK